MEQAVKVTAAIPAEPPESSLAARDTGFWPGFLMAAALTSIAIGIIWDISWHETIGRDTFWTPAHVAIYLGGVLGGCVGGWLAIRHTFFAGQIERDSSVGVFGARAPLGAWIAIWGALAMITSAPFDDWWHNAYGLDVKIISPPHVVLGLGMLGISVGALLLVLSRQNRMQEFSPRKGAGLFVYTGGVFIILGSVFILEYIFPNAQHGARFYIVCAMMYPARLIALSRAGRTTWPATWAAAVYMGMWCAVNWVLALFPAQAKLAPIFNPVTHMVCLPFPLLLIFPAVVIDLLLRKEGMTNGKLRQVGLALLLGALFLAVLLAVQWPFSAFLISPRADNWFFMGNRIWSYSSQPGEWQTRFWDMGGNAAQSDRINLSKLVMAWAIAGVSSGVGLFFGGWMRKVRR